MMDWYHRFKRWFCKSKHDWYRIVLATVWTVLIVAFSIIVGLFILDGWIL